MVQRNQNKMRNMCGKYVEKMQERVKYSGGKSWKDSEYTLNVHQVCKYVLLDKKMRCALNMRDMHKICVPSISHKMIKKHPDRQAANSIPPHNFGVSVDSLNAFPRHSRDVLNESSLVQGRRWSHSRIAGTTACTAGLPHTGRSGTGSSRCPPPLLCWQAVAAPGARASLLESTSNLELLFLLFPW